MKIKDLQKGNRIHNKIETLKKLKEILQYKKGIQISTDEPEYQQKSVSFSQDDEFVKSLRVNLEAELTKQESLFESL